MKRNISILGSTGSIGLTTLKIIDKKKSLFKPYLFAANKNYNKICQQIKKYKPNFFLINDEYIYKKVKNRFKSKKTKILNSLNKNIIKKKSHFTVSAISGIAGLEPTIFMIKKSKKILIANKETIICGWNLIKKLSIKHKTEIIPLDSEHYSILKLLKDTEKIKIKKIFLTASGGPFLNLSQNKIKFIKPKDALKHPKWNMRKKITVDSATLMNKVLEYVEAQKLFNLSKKKLEIIIHPESLVHAIIKMNNGLTKFIYHETTMIIPIGNALLGRDFHIGGFIKENKAIKNLTFQTPNKKTFPVLKILNRANELPSTSIIINAANELLVDYFLRKKIPFLGISTILQLILNDRNYRKIAVKVPKDLSQIKIVDSWARKKVNEKIKLIYE